MNSEDKYREADDRSHYQVCKSRLLEIKAIEKKCLRCTIIISLIIGVSCILNIRYNILSLASYMIVGEKLSGNAEFLLSGVTQFFSSIFYILIAIIATSKLKFLHLFLFSLYSAAVLTSIITFGRHSSDLITIIMGSVGIYFYYPTLTVWTDYKTISKIEGFPYFNERFAYQKENPEYKNENYREDYADEELEMLELKETIAIASIINSAKNKKDDGKVKKLNRSEMLEKLEKAKMDVALDTPVEIPHRGDSKKAREQEKEEQKNKKSRLELARELAEKANKFDFEIENDKNKK